MSGLVCRYLQPENNEPNSCRIYDFLKLVEERSVDTSGDHHPTPLPDRDRSHLTLSLHVHHLNEQRTLLKLKYVDLIANYPWNLTRCLPGDCTEVFQSWGIGIQQVSEHAM